MGRIWLNRENNGTSSQIALSTTEINGEATFQRTEMVSLYIADEN